MRLTWRPFPPGTDGFIQQWLTAGLFADLVIPSSPPAEDEETAGERWTFRFTRHRHLAVPGYRGRKGAWWLAVCCLRAARETQTSLVIDAPDGSYMGTETKGFLQADAAPLGVQLTQKPFLIAVAIPAADVARAFSVRVAEDGSDTVEVVHQLDLSRPVRLGRTAGRDVWIDHDGEACPTIWLEALNVTIKPVRLYIQLHTEEYEEDLLADEPLRPGQAELIEVPYPPSFPPGRAKLVVQAQKTRTEREITLTHTDHDWEVHLVPHFHYEPGWWNTQANYVEGDRMSAFHLIHKYLEAAADPGFTFLLEEVPYTKPYWDTFPEKREQILELVQAGRLALGGAMYNQPQTTLTSAETTIRSICYGTTYHRLQYGASDLAGWVLDVFGHDPNFPQFLVRAGHSTVSYARGPYKHYWGIPANRLSFPVDHWWIAPDGSRLLARLLDPCSYVLGRSLYQYVGPEDSWWDVAELFETASDYTSAHLQIWTVGGDFAEPVLWLPELSRVWNRRHLSPKIHLSTPSRFFSALAELVADDAVALPALTRDLNPVSNGCGISYVDTKLANRLNEGLLSVSEAVATLASLIMGAPYPDAMLDLAWRQLLFNSHHDALSGCESDQVYVDLLGGWREAYELGRDVLREALGALVSEDSGTLMVFNPLPWRRNDVVKVELPESWSGPCRVLDGEWEAPAEVLEHAGRKLLRFVARDLPAFSFKIFTVEQGKSKEAPDLVADALTIENEFYRLQLDPQHGDSLVSLVDKRSGRELVQQGRVLNDLVAHREYPELPGHGEGPWHVCTTGERHHASEEFPAEVDLEHTPTRVTLIIRSDHVNCRRETQMTLWSGLPRVDFETQIADYSGEDWLFKVHFPLAVRGGRPVYEVAGPAVSRTYCPGDQDTKELAWTQDSTANHYVDLTVPLRLIGTVGIGGDVLGELSVGMVEIVCPPDRRTDEEAPLSRLLLALSSVGVTASVTWPEHRRFGDITWDSNVPDFRLVIGTSADNAFTRHALREAGVGTEAELKDWTASHGWAVALLPGLKLGLPAELPIVLVWSQDREAEAEALEHIAAQVRKFGHLVGLVPSSLRAHMPSDDPDEGGVALLNRGTLSYCCYSDQTLTLALMRSCTGWPSGVWIDKPRRTCPDGSGFQLEHWSHRFEYALVSHEGHWRESGLGRRGYEFNRPPVAVWGRPSRSWDDRSFLQAGSDLVLVESASVVATVLKPAGTGVGLPLDADSSVRRVLLRLQETAGSPVEARVRLRCRVAEAWKCDLLERPLQELAVDEDAVVVPLGQFETASVLLDLESAMPAPRAPVPAHSPKYSRWWRYNCGAAPVGMMPVVVLFDADAPLQLRPGEERTLGLTVSTGYVTEESRVEVRIHWPEGWSVGDNEYQTTAMPGGYATRNVRMRVPMDAAPGQYVVRAVVQPPFGPLVYDVLHVAVDEEPSALAEASLEPLQVNVRRGDAMLLVRARNLSRSALDGEVLLVAPFEAWEMFERASRPVSLPPQGEATVEYRLRCPARPLKGWLWAMAKVLIAGQVLYTDTARLDL